MDPIGMCRFIGAKEKLAIISWIISIGKKPDPCKAWTGMLNIQIHLRHASCKILFLIYCILSDIG